MSRYVFINDQFIYESEAKLSIFDSSITSGDRTTEVARTFLHKPFKLELHIERLYDGLQELLIDINYSKNEILQLTHELLERNRVTEADDVEWQIVYIVTRGLESLFHLFEPSQYKPTIAILCFPLKNRLGGMKEKYKNGVKLLFPSQRAIPNLLMAPQIKSRGRVHFKMAQLEIRKRDKEATPLLLDYDDCVTETTGANIFFVKDNTLYTPSTSSVLSGITRNYIMGLAGELNIDVVEKKIPFHEVKEYQEAFITSTIIGLVYVKQIENHTYLNGQRGPVTDQILKLFAEKVGVDFVTQSIGYVNSM
jgi:branched-chain amino acid aminotransferase